MSSSQTDTSFSIRDELSGLIDYHNGWKRFSSYASFWMTAASIVGAAAASVAAGLRFAVAASILAALATVFTSLDKVLQFRERWDLHRMTADSLSEVYRDMEVKGVTDSEAADQIAAIVKNYNDKMSTFRAHTGS